MAEFDGIPRVIADISDGNLRTVPVPGSPKVTLLGITDNSAAKENEPTLIRPQTNLADFDLSNGAPSELSKAIIEARDGGAENIEVVVISKVSVITPADRKTKLADTYKLLINHPLDVVVPVGARIDTPNQTAASNFAYDLAAFCYKATKNFNACVGVIATEPPVPFPDEPTIILTAGYHIASGTNPTIPTVGKLGRNVTTISLAELENWVAKAETYNTAGAEGASFTSYDGTTDANTDGVPDTFAMWATSDEVLPVGTPPSSDSQVLKDKNKNPIDIGKLISVVAGAYRFTNDISKKVDPTNGFYHNDGAAAYAGRIASLRPHHPPTNKTIRGLDVIRNLSIGQADRLSQKRFVVFQDQPKGITVVSAMTGAYNISKTYRSDFVRLSTVRITLEAIERIRSVANPFLGEPHNGVSENALRSEIDQVLLKLQTEGALRSYAFELVSTAAMQVLGELTIDLQLVPAFEITQITLNVALRQE